MLKTAFCTLTLLAPCNIDSTRGIPLQEWIEEGDDMGIGLGEDLAQDGQERIVWRIVGPERKDAAPVELARQTQQSTQAIKRTMIGVQEVPR